MRPNATALKPPVPYFGGKQRLAGQLTELLSRIEHDHYVEPFCGSLAVLLAKPKVRMETVNDLDGQLIYLDVPHDGCSLGISESVIKRERLAAAGETDDLLGTQTDYNMQMVLGLAGVGATLVTAFIAAWVALYVRRPRRSKLELVDVVLAEAEPDSRATSLGRTLPAVDIKVRNLGGQPAVIKRVNLSCEQALKWPASFLPRASITDFETSFVGASLISSEHYAVILPEPWEADGYTGTIPVSQHISPGGVDRFRLILTSAPSFDTRLWRLRMDLVYDGDDRRVALPSCAITVSQNLPVVSPQEVADGIAGFYAEVEQIKVALQEQELFLASLPDDNGEIDDLQEDPPCPGKQIYRDPAAPDPRLHLVDSSGWGATLTPEFQDPERAVRSSLRELESRYREVIALIEAADLHLPVLTDAHPKLAETLAALPELSASLAP